ncbi:MAG: SMP-30/gluconolactonase/LRE family protein [Bacteroidota bacterium]
MRRVLTIMGSLLGLLLLYLLFWPVRHSFEAWSPLEAPDMQAGDFAVNQSLLAAERFPTTAFGKGPEDVALDTNGLIYGGLQNGKILRYQADGSAPEVFADTKGRPLGLHFDQQMNLIVADAQKGLLSINPEGKISVLSIGIGDYKFYFTDDLDIATDGTIYFSDASYIATAHDYKEDIMAHCACGKLLSYHPSTQKTELLADSLYFANGIAISPDQSFVLVNETSMYRVLKYWLKGPKAGSMEVLIDNLPGFPDGISTGKHGVFWVALANPRNPTLDALLPSPFIRKIVARLPDAVRPQPERYGFVLGIDQDGKVLYNLQDPSGAFAPVTSVQEENGILYLGSLTDPAWAKIPVPR